MTHELTRQPQGGLKLRRFDDYWTFAETVVNSGMAPKGMNTAGVLVCMQYGAEIGLSPMQSVQNIACINGKPGLYGDGMLAVCRASGLFDDAAFEETVTGEGDAMVAVCRIRRKPDGKVAERAFTAKQAKRAKLWGKSGPWSDYPERMLQMRARSFALRDTFPDVLKGLIAVEELRDYPEEPAPQPKQENRTVEVITAPAITHEAKPKPKKKAKPEVVPVKYGEYGQALYERLLQEASTEGEADALMEKWTQGTSKSHKRVCCDEQKSLAVLQMLREAEEFERQQAEVRETTELFPAADAMSTGPYGEG